MKQFNELGISAPILRAISEEKFTEPTEIQEKAIPPVISGKDVIAESATGSGKTLAFGCGILQHAVRGKGIQALILTPTRELAEQNGRALKIFSRYQPLHIAMVYGGVAIGPQIDALRTADIVVGTPGRILDHLEQRTLRLTNVNTLVLDEADRMLDMGFIEDVERIISQCPKKRQTLLFSATISSDIAHLARKHLHEPIRVSARSQVDPKKLVQVYYDVLDNLKFSLLAHLLKQEQGGLVMVFCNTRRNTDFVAKNLTNQGINATAIHGGLSQAKRNSIMKMFHSKSVYVLVCTDVAARGLDIPGVSHVYNYDAPNDDNQYIHRIGRTARAGKEGIAINLVSSRDHENFSRIVRDNAVKIRKEVTPQVERVKLQLDSGRPGRFGGGFRRGDSHGNSNRRFGLRRQFGGRR